MRYAFFAGCKIPHFLPHYGQASRKVLTTLGVDLVDMEFNCCGYPMSHLYYQSSLLAAARNLALAEAQGLDLLTPCKCCFGNFKRAMHALGQDDERRRQVEADLAREGLPYPKKSQVKHMLSLLHHDLGLAKLRPLIKKPYDGLRVAVLYGCHALRPSRVTNFDHPYTPVIFDQLVELTGARSVEWAGKLSCCGSPIAEHNPELSLSLINRRLGECKQAKADVLCLSCTYSQLQAERAFGQPTPPDLGGLKGAVVYPQLLGLALGLSPADLALSGTTPDASYLQGFQKS